MERSAPIAFFDSGLGGISVLREAAGRLPKENFLYYGDSLHAPYGVLPVERVRELTLCAAEKLVKAGAKALVVACNTATSAAIGALRQRYPLLEIIGTEPALKPAVAHCPGGRILVLATAMTVKEEKFQKLRQRLDEQAEVIAVPCSGLMEFVERGILGGAEVEDFLRNILRPYLTEPVDAVVLGCTHYPFLRGAIRRVIGPDAKIFDGSAGITSQLIKRLEERSLLNERGTGSVVFLNSLDTEQILALSRRLFLAGQDG